MALHVGRSLDHYTNYQVMGKARELWPQVPQVPVGKRRMGCIVGMMHIKECVAAHLCRDRWKSIPTSHPYYLVTPPRPPFPGPISTPALTLLAGPSAVGARPISTRGGTRLVRLVRGKGGGGRPTPVHPLLEPRWLNPFSPRMPRTRAPPQTCRALGTERRGRAGALTRREPLQVIDKVLPLPDAIHHTHSFQVQGPPARWGAALRSLVLR